MEGLTYSKVFTKDGAYWIKEISPKGTTRRVEEFQPDYNLWLERGNIPTEEAYVAPDIEFVRTTKIIEIQSMSNKAIAELELGYTQGEIKSFDRQRQGALDIIAGNTTTPDAQYVAALAAARSAAGDTECTTESLANKIKENVDTATAYTISILGKQQGLEAKVRVATTIEEIELIVW